jgi:hypothetical protein
LIMPASLSLLAKALLLLLLSAGPLLAVATEGFLDSSYGTAGVAKLTLPGWQLAPQAAVQAADGTLYVAGQARGQQEPIWHAFLTKFTPAGAVDASFGTGGHLLLPMGESFTTTQLFLTSATELRLVGYTRSKAVIAAISSSGQVITSYGRAGFWVGTADPEGSGGVGVKVVGAGQLSGGEIMLVIQQSNFFSLRTASSTGTGNEKVSQDLRFGTAECAALDVTGSWLLVAGSYFESNGPTTGVLRYSTSNPGADSLESEVISHSPLTGQLGLHSLHSVADGTTTLLAQPTTGAAGLTLSRFRAGQLDTTFSTDGLQTYNNGTLGDSPAGVTVRALDGRLLVASTRTDSATSSSFCLLRLVGDGTRDLGFGSNGVLSHSPAGIKTKAAGMLVQSDSKVLLFGSGEPTGSAALTSVYVMRFDTGIIRTNSVPPRVIAAPVATNAALGSSSSLSVTVAGSATLSYQWFKDGAALTGETNSSITFPQLSLAEQGSYHVQVTNAWGRVTTNPVYLNVVWLPQISGPVQPLNPTPLGTTVNLSVTLTGGDPLTGFSYQWQRNGSDIPEATSSSLTLPGITTPEGDYQCVVSNADGSVTSAVAPLHFMPEKTARLTLTNALLPVGSPFRPQAIVSQRSLVSQPFYDAGVYQTWVKDGAFLPRAPDVASTVLSDAGSYHCRVGTFGGILITPTVQLGLVDTLPFQVVVAAGQTARLTAPAAGKGLSFVWQKGGAPLSTGGRITGVNQQTLVISQSTDADEGTYQCIVSAYGQSLATGDTQLAVESQAPVILHSTLPSGQVGRAYTAALNALYSPTQFRISGLPTGFSYNTRTGLITGLPEAAGNYPLSVTATNPVGTSAPASFMLMVQPLPAGVAGTFSGLVGANDAPVGIAKVEVTSTGGFSASLSVGNDDGSTHSLVCTGALRHDPGAAVAGSYAARSTVMTLPSFMRTGTGLASSSCTLELLWTPGVGMSAQLTPSSGTARPVSLHSNPWRAGILPAVAYRGYYTTALSWARSDQGEGYASFTVADAGTYTLVGRLPDGAAVSHSGFVDGSGASWLHSWLYGQRGHLAGTLQLQDGTGPLYTDTNVRCTLRWTSPAGLNQEPMQAEGARYLPPSAPGATGLLMSAPATVDNVSLTLENGVLGYQLPSGTAITSPTSFTRDITLQANHVAVLPTYNRESLIRYSSLTFNALTGHFSGVAVRYYPQPVTLNYQGILTRSDGEIVSGHGTGYFSNTFVPTGSSTPQSVSGRVSLLPNSLDIE